jgi:hypothetical protein
MGIMLLDGKSEGPSFSINFWHWRAIVEAVRRLDVLPPEKLDGLHEPFCGNGLTREEALLVADAIEEWLLPALEPEQRLLLHGEITDEPDDGVMRKDEPERNYSTNRQSLVRFADFCRSCSGFAVC